MKFIVIVNNETVNNGNSVISIVNSSVTISNSIDKFCSLGNVFYYCETLRHGIYKFSCKML